MVATSELLSSSQRSFPTYSLSVLDEHRSYVLWHVVDGEAEVQSVTPRLNARCVGMVYDPLRPQLCVFELTEELEEWFREHEPHDANRNTRERVIRIFNQCTADRGISHVDGLRRFYAGMRTCCLLAASTACTYLKYIVYGLKLPTRNSVVRGVLRVANLESARCDPVRPCHVAPKAKILHGVSQLSDGPVRRAAILMLATGARCADVAKLQRDEVFVEESGNSKTLLQVAWSEQKARKSYGCRITIRYPEALIGGALAAMLHEVAGYNGSPCAGVTFSDVNAAMREVGVKVTTRSFRVCYIEAAYCYLEEEGSGRPVWTLTGHKSDAIPSSAYLRNAVRAKAEEQRHEKTRAAVRARTPPAAGKRRQVQPARPAEASRRSPPQRRRATGARTPAAARASRR